MYTLLKPIKVREVLLKRGIRVFTPHLFAQVFELTMGATKYFLETQTKEAFLLRLKKGLYTLQTDLPSEEEIANVLYQPSYISFEYALAYYGILPEMPYTITSATTKSTRVFTANTHLFSYRTIKREAYTGYSLLRNNERAFSIADKEKAFVDYCYFVSLRKNTLNDRMIALAKQTIDKKKCSYYATLFDSKRLNACIETHI